MPCVSAATGAVKLANLHPDHIAAVVAGLGQIDPAILVDTVQQIFGFRIIFQRKSIKRKNGLRDNGHTGHSAEGFR